MKTIDKVLVALGAAVCLGCAGSNAVRSILKTRSIGTEARSEAFNARILPYDCGEAGCRAFTLEVENLTDRPLEIDWARTKYVDRGQTRGGFMWEGVKYSDRDAPAAPDVVLPRSKFSKVIAPTILVSFVGGNVGWREDPMGVGEKGVYLTVRDGPRMLATMMSYEFEIVVPPRGVARKAKDGRLLPVDPTIDGEEDAAHRPAEVITVRSGPE